VPALQESPVVMTAEVFYMHLFYSLFKKGQQFRFVRKQPAVFQPQGPVLNFILNQGMHSIQPAMISPF